MADQPEVDEAKNMYTSPNSHGPLLVCSESDLRTKGRAVFTVEGREIVVFCHKGKYHALDRQCYHDYDYNRNQPHACSFRMKSFIDTDAGGPLQLADIEDIQGHSCIICPWHRYIIRLDNGEGMFKSIDPYDLTKPPEWASKGIKQRTHHVTTKEDQVYVQLSDLTQQFPSDYYYSDKYRKLVWTVPAVKKSS